MHRPPQPPRARGIHLRVHRALQHLVHREPALGRPCKEGHVPLQEPRSVRREEDQGRRVRRPFERLLHATDQLAVFGVVEEQVGQDQEVEAPVRRGAAGEMAQETRG